jgi:zinc protease
MVVVAVGDLRHEEVEAQVAAAFADLPDGEAAVYQRAAPPAAVARTERLSTGARQAQVVLGWPTPGLDSPDRYALTVLNAYMGSGGQRLAGELRDRLGLATRIDSGYWELTDVGTWLVAAAGDPARSDALIEAIMTEVRGLRDEPLSPDELAEAQAYVRGSTRRGQERAVDQARDIASGVALGHYQPIDVYLDRIGAVTVEDVQRVARAYLDPDAATLVVLGP